jgi:hypothetical protein
VVGELDVGSIGSTRVEVVPDEALSRWCTEPFVESMVQAAVDSVTAKQAAPNLGQLLIAASSHEREKGICLERSASGARPAVPLRQSDNRGYPGCMSFGRNGVDA